MSELAMYIWLVALAIAVLGGIPYWIWIIIALLKKRWRKFCISLVVPVLVYGIIFMATAYVDQAVYEKNLAEVYGVKANFGDSIFSYHSDRSF